MCKMDKTINFGYRDEYMELYMKIHSCIIYMYIYIYLFISRVFSIVYLIAFGGEVNAYGIKIYLIFFNWIGY